MLIFASAAVLANSVAFDALSNLYVGDTSNRRIRKIDLSQSKLANSETILFFFRIGSEKRPCAK